jgi:ornithine cyclodeaminase/alanine dehydrogenase-like protein (mu-crystallin family)
MLVLSHADVEALLPMADCIAVLDEAMRALSRGEYFQPLRMKAVPENAPSRMVFMPALRRAGAKLWSNKQIVVTPDNAKRGLDSHQGAVLLHDGETGELLAAVHAGAITAIRTAAASAVATRALARKDACVVAILGTGVQGRAHLDAMRCILPQASFRVWSRNRAHAETIAGPSGVSVAHTIAAACDGADVICAVTAAREPILSPATIPLGCHVNAAGSSIATTRELDGAAMAAGSLFVDRRESTINESGDYLLALREGAIGPDHIRAEIGDVLLGRHPGRTSVEEITIYKSLGVAVQDLAAADVVFRRARERGFGVEAPF